MRAMCERSFYRTAVKSSRDAVHDHFTEDGVLTLPTPGSALPSGSGPNTVHYSIHFARRFTILTTPFNQDLCILRPRGSVACLGSAVRQSHVRLFNSLTRRPT